MPGPKQTVNGLAVLEHDGESPLLQVTSPEEQNKPEELLEEELPEEEPEEPLEEEGPPEEEPLEDELEELPEEEVQLGTLVS